MTTLPIEQRLPGDLIYGNAHAVMTALSRPLRCYSDPAWRWPEEPEPLPLWTRRAIDLALIRRYRQMRRERGGRP